MRRLHVGGGTLKIILAVILLGGGIGLLVVDASPVVLTWETASEVGTAGFNVYRRVATDDPARSFTQVNEELIPAAGDELTGASYSYHDEDVKPWRRYQYRIEEVEWDGDETLYPETVEVRAGLPTPWLRVEGGVLILLALLVIWRQWAELKRED